MFLELGILPVRYVTMTKHLHFLKYILNEYITSMIRKGYETLKLDSGNSDFVHLVQKDLMEIDVKMSDEEIQTLSVGKWKGIVRRKINQAAFKYLIRENLSKDKAKHIVFDKYQMRKYLFINKSTSLAQIIFCVCSGTAGYLVVCIPIYIYFFHLTRIFSGQIFYKFGVERYQIQKRMEVLIVLQFKQKYLL